jgi:hypothetical protein
MLLRMILACAMLIFAISLFAQNVGVGTVSPTQKLHVNGKVKVGDDANAPSAGTMRWNAAANDFEGFNGTEWLSLTQGKQAGTISVPGDIGQLNNYNPGASPSPVTDGEFGGAVDISGEWAVIGAPREGQGGAAYVFRKSGTNWNFFSSLTSADIGNKDRFGDAVAVDGNRIIVGSPYDSLNTIEYNGSAYIFAFNGTAWVQEQKIYNPFNGVREFFGESVDISGDMAIIGAYQADDGPNVDEGKAFVYKRNATLPVWNQNGAFTGSGANAGAYFGGSVSIYGSYVAISASFFDIPAPSTGLGAIYIYFFNGTSWSQQARLSASDAGNDLFGYAISLHNATLVVGARSKFEEYSGQGAAYVFFRSGTSWSQQAKLVVPKTMAFGSSVSISENILLIGAPDTRRYDPCGNITGTGGRTFAYKRTGAAWERFATLDMPGVTDGDLFGYAVAIDDYDVIISANRTDVNGIENSGKVVFGKLQ